MDRLRSKEGGVAIALKGGLCCMHDVHDKDYQTIL
jgi:hypothetical protein